MSGVPKTSPASQDTSCDPRIILKEKCLLRNRLAILSLAAAVLSAQDALIISSISPDRVSALIQHVLQA